VLGLVCVVVTAKPISLRRLTLLFFVTLILSNAVLGVWPVAHHTGRAVIASSSITLLVWSLPLIQELCETIRRRRLSLRALGPVSGAVQCTYGLAVAALAFVTVGGFLGLTQHFTPGSLLRVVILGMPIGVALHIASKVIAMGWR
jgi:hypothetical protein